VTSCAPASSGSSGFWTVRAQNAPICSVVSQVDPKDASLSTADPDSSPRRFLSHQMVPKAAGVQLVTPERKGTPRNRHDFHARQDKADGSRELGSNCSTYETTNLIEFLLRKTLTLSAPLCLQSLLEALLPP